MARMGARGFSELAKQFESLNARMERADIDKFCRIVAKELAARLLAKVIKRTPVGKKPKFEGEKTVKVNGESGKTRSFLTAEGARYEQRWSGYSGGTLRRGWTAKTEDEAKSGKNSDVVAYANSLPITKSGNKYEIEIINPVHYASYVEYGHRQTPGRFVPALGKRLKTGWVKGKFMLTLSEKEVEKISSKLVEEKLLKYLEGVFK